MRLHFISRNETETLGHLFRSALKIGQWYEMLSTRSYDEESNNNGGEGMVIKEAEQNKRVLPKVKNIPLHYTREVENMTIGILMRKPHQASVCRSLCTFGGKGHHMGDVLSHVNSKELDSVLAVDPWWKHEMYRISQFRRTREVSITVTEENDEKMLVRFSGTEKLCLDAGPQWPDF